jgi:DNA-binding NtrC family response regulator
MRIIIVDDEVKYTKLIQSSLEIDEHETWTATSGEEALRLVQKINPHLVISDIAMPGMDGIQLLDKIRSLPDPPEVIMVTADTEAKTAVQAMKKGAFEYVTKPFEMDELSLLVSQVADKKQLQDKTRHLEQQLHARYSFSSIIGSSAPMQILFDLMTKVKDLDTLVLIRGESGTGKELVAKALHFQSVRVKSPFIPVNCAAIPDNLMESELFGHKKGSFTGADRDKEGYCTAVGNGTLFLDEISELPIEMQSKLLRVLQEREFFPLGSNKNQILRARVICATNLNLEEAVGSGEFREDLFHRLNIFPLYMPPLCERKEDIPLLVEHFLKHHQKDLSSIDSETMDWLKQYSWPGNVRELENQLERAVILTGGGNITREHFQFSAMRKSGSETSGGFHLPDEGVSLNEIEKNYLLSALEKAGGNKTRAAELLGISRRAIYSKMKTHGLMK